jgi:hypothetical protein
LPLEPAVAEVAVVPAALVGRAVLATEEAAAWVVTPAVPAELRAVVELVLLKANGVGGKVGSEGGWDRDIASTKRGWHGVQDATTTCGE